MTPGLPDFLLARVVEDAARAREMVDFLDTFDLPDTAHFSASRLLADSTAKRRIVERERASLDESPGASVAMGDVLRFLALSYAHHPDYREEWNQ